VGSEVSEEHAASIFRVEVCRFSSNPGYMGKIQGECSFDPWYQPHRTTSLIITGMHTPKLTEFSNFLMIS
jgi:hypothetical protein